MISWAEGKVAFNGVALVLNARQQMSLLVVKMIVSLHRISDASPHMGMTSNKTRRVVISKELYQVFKKHKYLSNLYISQLYLWSADMYTFAINAITLCNAVFFQCPFL